MARRPVIFDCDGVLVDSEALSWVAWRRTAEACGIDITDDDVQTLTGRTADAVYETLRSKAGNQPIWERPRFLAGVEALTESLFREDLEAFEDGEDTAEHLHRVGYRLAVASSSSTPRLDLSLEITGLRPFFEHVIAGDQVERSKPEPDIYLAAADALGVDPTLCMAVEDSPSGITSAKAAGMYVVAVERGLFEPEAIRHADVVVPHLTPAVLFG